MTLGQGIEVGSLSFTVIRMLVVIGVARVVIRGEHVSGGWNMLDRMMIFSAICAVFSSFFHSDFSSALVFRLGFVYDTLGLYFLMRVFIEDSDSFQTICKIVIIVLIPVAVEMISERMTGRNSFAVFGGVSPESEIRLGKIRAQGPFAHSILAGTVGAVCWPMALLLWKQNRRLAWVGLITTGSIVWASRSSGPIMTSMFILFGLALWNVRAHMRLVRWGAVLGIVALAFVMKAPVYYLLARIDLTGSSTGWHRAELIHAAIDASERMVVCRNRLHASLDALWGPLEPCPYRHHKSLYKNGSDRWFAANAAVYRRSDCRICHCWQGNAVESKCPGRDQLFLMWTLGAILFGHAITWMSISYFDQSVVFLFLLLAAIGSLPVVETLPNPISTSTEDWRLPANEANLCHHR